MMKALTDIIPILYIGDLLYNHTVDTILAVDDYAAVLEDLRGSLHVGSIDIDDAVNHAIGSDALNLQVV
jgi:hypothetical protein